MRPIHEGEIRFVGDEVQYHGAARRLLERIARKFSRLEGRTVTARQVAERLTASMQKGINMHADLVRVLDRMRQILERFRDKP